ncbi:YHS domain-containing (seleno)protein [Pseudophaeobacter sp.]|uniref:YHS domain-containing (seleno)protein n=1 Tax=Pseudophaeobacter sp. TaxID=1971739 RepID=UPI003299F179
MSLRHTLAALAVTLFITPLAVRADTPIFSTEDGLALGGYDVVAFFEDQNAISGSEEFSLMWKGVVWRFTSSGNQARFEANPRAYAPVFGGYCAYAMSQGYLAPGDPQLWLIDNGELYLLNNDSVRQIWQDEAPDLLREAQGNWPGLLRD